MEKSAATPPIFLKLMKFRQAIKTFFKSITPFEYALWGVSVSAILLSFFLMGNTDYLNLAGSLIGACALILVAKGNVIGQILCVVFALFYGFVSFSERYYGEMITYLGMSAPIAVVAVVSWLRHPFEGKKTEVEINKIAPYEYLIIIGAGLVVSVAFLYILWALGTANLIWSTVSVFTSFTAVVLTQRRSPFYAVAYAANDIILIVLWTLAAQADPEKYALVVCFAVFLANDSYGFFNWLRMRKKQRKQESFDENL